MDDATHVVLVGLSGTGKSTLAPLLAERLGIVSVDVDSLVEEATGRSVASVFAERGEAGFRSEEMAALRHVLDGPAAVVATGGGILTNGGAADLLGQRATVVWLRAEPADLARRLRADGHQRPLLAGDAEATLRRLSQERTAGYREAADLVVDVGGAAPGVVLDTIADALVGTPT